MPDSIPAWQAKTAGLTHVSMYVLLLTMPVTGYLGAAFSGDPMAYFGLPLPAWASANGGIVSTASLIVGIAAANTARADVLVVIAALNQRSRMRWRGS